MEALLINEVNDKVLVTAFTNGLRSRKFLFSVYKNDLKTMADMLYQATKYMNVRMPWPPEGADWRSEKSTMIPIQIGEERQPEHVTRGTNEG